MRYEYQPKLLLGPIQYSYTAKPFQRLSSASLSVAKRNGKKIEREAYDENATCKQRFYTPRATFSRGTIEKNKEAHTISIDTCVRLFFKNCSGKQVDAFAVCLFSFFFPRE